MAGERLERMGRSVRPRRRLRLATARARILPSFLIVGAQRAGTTSLFRYLRLHPDVAPPTAGEDSVRLRKELHFFDQTPSPGLGWYRAFFPLAAQRRLTRLRGRDIVAGEATPSYLARPDVPARVAATLPDVRLIALLRDPTERAYSHYQLLRRKGRETRSFEDALANEQKRRARAGRRGPGDPSTLGLHSRAYVSRGLYAEQIERWLAHFPREQLLVLRSEDLFERPAEVYAETLDFLGLPSWRPAEFEHRNRVPYAPIDPALRARLAETFAESNARLEMLLGQDFDWGAPAGERARSASAS